MRFAAIDLVSKAVRTVMLGLALACLINLTGWMVISTIQPSYATPTTSSQVEREQAYEQAKAVVEDPKMGVEKEYEKEMETYQQDNEGEGGLLDKAKELAAEAAGTAHKTGTAQK